MDLTDSKIQIVAEHYSDTFSIIQAALKKRDRLFSGVLLILFLMLFLLYTPSEFSHMFAKVLSEKLGLNEALDFVYVQSAIWFLLLAGAVKYFQAVVFLERQYEYIHQLEAEIAPHFEKKIFTREGATYLNNYPAFLKWASFLYTALFPLILLVVPAAKIIVEFREFEIDNALLWFDFAICIFLFISLGLFLFGKFGGEKDA